MSYTVLLVEDNPHIMEINYEALVMEDYRVLTAGTGRECLESLRNHDVDLIVLDIMLPDADGLALCRKIKAQHDIPILFLSALGENEQIIEGLRAGGDDYLPKPYDIGVLLARVEARLRASQRERRVVTYGGLRMDTVLTKGFWQDQDLMLTHNEYILLLLLAQNGSSPVSKEILIERIWGSLPEQDHGDMYSTVFRLNKKLEAAEADLRVVSRRMAGYALDEI